MRARMFIHAAACFTVAACALAGTACNETTGGAIVSFKAAASGPSDAVKGSPYTFVNDRGWTISLTAATLHVGALYLDQSEPVSGAQNTSCILPGTYVAEVTAGADIDLLSPAAQPFPVSGVGTATQALVGQVWLTGGPIDQVSDTTPILNLAGTATKDGASVPFTGNITISENRVASTSDNAAGANPICKQRIVSPISLEITPSDGGTLLLRIDPKGLFVDVEMSELPADPSGNGFAFTDDETLTDEPSRALYLALHASAGLYTFAWSP